MRFRPSLIVLILMVSTCGGEVSDDETVTSDTAATATTGAVATTVLTEVETTDRNTVPPWGLDKIAMPDRPDAVAAVFSALPSDMSGLPRTDVPGRVEGALGAEYGSGMCAIRATPLAAVETPSDQEFSAFEWLESMATAMEGEVKGSVLEIDAPLAWIASAGEADGETVYFAAWCHPEGSWYFDAMAESAEARLELIEGFIAAVAAA